MQTHDYEENKILRYHAWPPKDRKMVYFCKSICHIQFGDKSKKNLNHCANHESFRINYFYRNNIFFLGNFFLLT
jgi:hypothetical protein